MSMTARSQRPLSAIFLGNPDNQLPSPPQTISTTSSGSTGDGSTSGAKLNIARHFPQFSDGSLAETMAESRFEGRARPRRSLDGNSSNDNDDDDDGNDDNEDHTAKLSADQRLLNGSDTGSGSSSRTGSRRSSDKPRTLLDRTRKTFERLSAPRISSLSPSTRVSHLRGASPIPPRPRSSAGQSSSSRATPSRASHEVDLISGSETERGAVYSSSDDLSTTPPTAAPPVRPVQPPVLALRESIRERVHSVPSPPRPKAVSRPSHHAESSNTLSRRSRRATLADDGDGNIFADAVAAATGARRSPRRTPLPQEFRDLNSPDEKPFRPRAISPEIPTIVRPPSSLARKRDISPGLLAARGLPDLSTARPGSPRMQLHPSRSSTVRETSSTSRRNFLHSRWASEDHTMAESPEGEVDEEGRRIPYRYEARGASAESALVNGARADGVRSRLVDEGLRAAGLTRRKESEDVFTTPPPADPSLRRHQRGATMHDRGWDEIQRRSHSRLEEEPPTYVPGEREPRSPPPPTGTPSLRPRSIQALVGSRPGTSTGIYARGPDDSPRTAVTPLRTHYSSYNLGVAGGTSSPRLPPERSFDSPMRTLLPLPAPGSGGSPMIHGGTEHTRLLLDALSMFESHYSRLNASPDVLRSAQAIVNSASTLNSLLRAGSASALEEQIEADVATSARDADPNANVAEVWKRVGADYRESLRISDDLVRSMTGFMLSIGRTLREGLSSGALTHGRGDDGMSRLSDGTSSRDGGRKSVDGRGSVEGRNADGRRSVEGGRIRSYDGEIHRRNQSVAGMRPDASGPALSAVPSRPSSSMSVLREREREYERQQEREREHEREWDRHRLAQAQESPTPAPAVQSAPPPPVGANTATPSAQPRDRQSIFSSARRYFPSRNSGGESPVSPTEPRRLTRLAIPPPLPTLHSESLVRSKTAPSKSPRKSKPLPSASATLRGSSIMPLGAPSPTTHLTTATVVTSQDTDSPAADAIRRSNTYSFSLSRASGHPATAGATVGEREQRKRTLSTTSATYGEDPIFAPPNGKAPESPRRRLGSKVRMSLDGHSVAENAALGKVEFSRR